MNERLLLDQEEILNRITDGIFSLDTEWRFTYLNDAAAAIFRRPIDSLLGKNVWDLYPDATETEFLPTFEQAMERQEQISTQLYYEPWDRWFEERLYPSEDGLTVIAQDITEQKRRERQIKSIHALMHAFLTAKSSETVAKIAVDGARDILGLEANAIHLYDDNLEGLAPVAHTEALTELVGTLPTFSEGDSIAWGVFEQGEIKSVDDVRNEAAVFNPNTKVRSELYIPLGEYGVLLAATATLASFDEEDILLSDILGKNVVLALEQIERNEQLQDRERELVRQNSRLEEFANIVAHDLRNPLNVASGCLDLARDECDSDQLDVVAGAHERMNVLIADMLSLARQGNTIAETGPVDLGHAIELSWRHVETKNAELIVDVNGKIYSDRNRLKQLLENLFRNAVEHGGPDVKVTVGMLDAGFYVEDTGHGIPENMREDILRPGYTTINDGTGFGLSIVQQIVTAHGWDMRILESESGGARFEIIGVEYITDKG